MHIYTVKPSKPFSIPNKDPKDKRPKIKKPTVFVKY